MSRSQDTGEPLLLLPGMMCDARLFTHQLAEFSASRQTRVCPLTEGNSVAALAASIVANAPPRFALAGLSMGGIVAMEIVRQYPEKVTRLALLDTNPLADTAEKRAMRERQIASVRNGGLRDIMMNEMKPNYLAETPRTEEILRLCMAMAEDLGNDVFISQSQALAARPDQSDTLRGVTVPTLVLCGEHDALCPIERHEYMQQIIPESRLVVVPDAGHLPVLEQAQRTNGELNKWLKM